jgi:hypothetical protein
MKRAIWVKCNGEAHSNPHIDHCGVCMPFWGEYPKCPDCGRKIVKGIKRGKCPGCGKMVNVERPAEALDISHIDTALKAGDHFELTRAIADLEMTIERIQRASAAIDKITEWENLRTAWEALKRAEGALTPIMFRFVGK